MMPRASAVTWALAILGTSLVTALAAQVAVPLPWTPVPVTAQTLAVLLAGAALGSRRAAAAMLLYLAEGAAGLPVFAGGAAGPLVLAGPTGGYLVGFVPAAFVTGWLVERGWARSVWTAFVAMVAGSLPIFACGLAWLARFVPAPQLVAAGLSPFVIGDILKALVGAGALPGAWRLLASLGLHRS